MAEFLSAQSVADMFDTSVSTVRRWEDRGVIQPVNVGGLKRYDVTKLLQAARGALDVASGRRARSTDPDEATRRAQDAARESGKATAGRRHG